VVVTEVRQRPSESKQAAQKFAIERFNLKKLNDVGVKSMRTKLQIDLQLWKTWMMMLTSVGLGKVLQRL
jgi:hypothetical protein